MQQLLRLLAVASRLKRSAVSQIHAASGMANGDTGSTDNPSRVTTLTSAATLVGFDIDDCFIICGPAGLCGRDAWWPGKMEGWQPKAYTSHPADPASRVVPPTVMWIDFGGRFWADEFHTAPEVDGSVRLIAAKCKVKGEDPMSGRVMRRTVWINVYGNGQCWARRPRQIPGRWTCRR